VVDANGVHDGEKHEPWQKRGAIALKMGKHPIRVDFFNNNRGKGQALEVLWAPYGEALKPISNSALGGVDAPPAPPMGPQLLNGNTAVMPDFKKRMKGNTSLEESGAWPQPWSANLWDANSTAKSHWKKSPPPAKTAIAVRNLEGQAAIQFYTWQNLELKPGRYQMSFEYLTGAAPGELTLNFKGMDKQNHALAASEKAWKKFSTTWEVTGNGVSLSPQFKNSGMGAANTLYLRTISLRRFEDTATP
jgi:hypothetical protein